MNKWIIGIAIVLAVGSLGVLLGAEFGNGRYQLAKPDGGTVYVMDTRTGRVRAFTNHKALEYDSFSSEDVRVRELDLDNGKKTSSPYGPWPGQGMSN